MRSWLANLSSLYPLNSTKRNAMFALENSIQTMADNLCSRAHFHSHPLFIQEALNRYALKHHKSLTLEQQSALFYLLESKSIACLVGGLGQARVFHRY